MTEKTNIAGALQILASTADYTKLFSREQADRIRLQKIEEGIRVVLGKLLLVEEAIVKSDMKKVTELINGEFEFLV